MQDVHFPKTTMLANCRSPTDTYLMEKWTQSMDSATIKYGLKND
jgi:hypothetical protein